MDPALLVSSAIPTLQMLLMGTAGAMMGRKGVLDPRGRQTLSQLVFWIFVPCLTFGKLAQSVDLGNLAIWWFIPLNVILSIMVGLCLGWLAVTVLRPPLWLRPHVMCATAIGNVGNLPMILVMTLCKDSRWPFQAALPPGHCADRGIAYVAFGSWVAFVAQFTIAYNLMEKRLDTVVMPLHAELAELHHSSPRALLPQQVSLLQPLCLEHLDGRDGDGHSSLPHVNGPDAGDRSLPLTLSPLACAAEESPDLSHSGVSPPDEAMSWHLGRLLPDGMQRMETGDGEGAPLLNADVEGASGQPDRSSSCGRWGAGREGRAWGFGERGRGPVHMWVRGVWQMLSRWSRNVQWSSMFNPPTLSAFGGIIVGCVPAAKDLLFGDNDPPLRLVGDAISMMGDAMIPSVLLLLGAVLHRGPSSSQLPARVILGVVIFRLLLMPVLGLGLVMGLHAIGFFHAPDPLFMLVLLVSHSMPTALQLGTVAALRKSGEAEMSALLFWQYMACLVTLPLALSVQRHLL